MPKVNSSMKKAKTQQDSLSGATDHVTTCMCETVLPKDLQTKPHCGWYDLIDFDPCIDSDKFLQDHPLTEWTQVARGEAVQDKTILAEYRAYVSDESLTGFWTGLIIWQRDSDGCVHCPFPGCDVQLSGTGAVHSLLHRHWKHQHACPYVCKICGASYATDGALKVHFFRVRHNEDGPSRVNSKGSKLKGMTRQNFSGHRKEAITRYILKAERLMAENGK